MTSAKKPSKKESIDLSTNVLKEIMDEIGEDGAQLLGSDAQLTKIRGVISTGNVEIDDVIGRDGVPLGRLAIITGGEGGGKTTLALQIVAECQKMGGVVIYADTEYKLDPEYAKKLGVDIKNLVIYQPNYLEAFFETMEKVIEKRLQAEKNAVKELQF